MQHAARELAAPGQLVAGGAAEAERPGSSSDVHDQRQREQLGQGHPFTGLPSVPYSLKSRHNRRAEGIGGFGIPGHHAALPVAERSGGSVQQLLCVWLRRARLASGAGRRRRGASAGRGPCDPGQREQLAPRRTGRGRLPKRRGSAAAIPCGRPGGRPGSCQTTCGNTAPADPRSRGDRRRGPCPYSIRGPDRAGRSSAGCRSGASSRTAASTAASAVPQPAGRRDRTRAR